MNEKIKCLGKEFNSEDERREYFRNELRKKLPELKKMEGFPIGEDDNIINLSDPPYYTACPNPWLNNFILEWEFEKKELEKRGSRNNSLEVDEPYAADVSVGKNNPIYMAHSYHTKVPHPAIMRYILHYTQPGDIVYDGFAGTGMTGVAAGLCENPDETTKYIIEREIPFVKWGKRNSICGDLSPAASFIASNFNTKNDVNEFYISAQSALKKISEEFDWLFKIEHDEKSFGQINYIVWSDVFECPGCKNEIVLFDCQVDLEKSIIHDDLNCTSCGIKLYKKSCDRLWETKFDPLLNQSIKISKTVPVIANYMFRGKRYERPINNRDLIYLQEIENYKIDSFVPIVELVHGYNTTQPIKTNGVTHVHQFYSKRNLIFLSALWSELKSNPLKMWVTSSMIRTTRMYKFTADRKMGTVSGTLYLPSFWTENAAPKLLERKLSDLVKAINIVQENNVVQITSATNSNLNDESIDYIFTDPPFGANIMYSELNLLWESWLNVRTDNKEEAIENKFQNKSTLDYQQLMYSCFLDYYRVLKPGKWMTVEFSNTSAAVWNGIQTAITNSGFVIANVAALDKKQGSFKAVSTVTAVKQDLVISCYKPSSELENKARNDDSSNFSVWDFVIEHLKHLPIHILKDNSTTAIIERSPKILFDRLIAFYVQRNLPVPIDSGIFQNELKKRFIERDGMFFTNEQVQEYDMKKKNHPEFVQLSILVSSEQDGVLWLKSLLTEQSLAYQEIQPLWMQALAGVRKGDIIPELSDILEENFLKNSNGKWYVANLENETDLEKLRNKRLLKQFETYKEEAAKPKGKIKEARVEALRIGFKQCYQEKDFKTIVHIGDRIPNNLLMEDEVLLQFYDIAISRV
jgi:DNA modification methylase